MQGQKPGHLLKLKGANLPVSDIEYVSVTLMMIAPANIGGPSSL